MKMKDLFLYAVGVWLIVVFVTFTIETIIERDAVHSLEYVRLPELKNLRYSPDQSLFTYGKERIAKPFAPQPTKQNKYVRSTFVHTIKVNGADGFVPTEWGIVVDENSLQEVAK